MIFFPICPTNIWFRGLRGPHIDLEMTEEWGKIPRLGLASTSKFWFPSPEKFLVLEKNCLRGLEIFFWEVSSLASASKFSFDVSRILSRSHCRSSILLFCSHWSTIAYNYDNLDITLKWSIESILYYKIQYISVKSHTEPWDCSNC